MEEEEQLVLLSWVAETEELEGDAGEAGMLGITLRKYNFCVTFFAFSFF